MTIYSIYRATNKINNKVYIGFDSAWPARKGEHGWSAFHESSNEYNNHFHRAIRKHSFEVFEWEVIYQSKDAKHTLNVMENYFIVENDSFNSGYNSTLGGQGGLGRKDSDEVKKKRASKHIGKKRSEQTKKNISISKIGSTPWNKNKTNVYSEETLSLMRRPKTDEHKKSLSKAKSGKKASVVAVESNRKAQTGLFWWNNGIIHTRAKVAPDENFIRGKLPGQKRSKKIKA